MAQTDQPNRPYVTRRQAHVDGYPTGLVREARELAAGGWGPNDIVRIFARRGIDPLPCPTTVRDWLLGRVAVEQRREQQRRFIAGLRARESGGRLRGKARSPEFKVERVTALRQRRISYRAIAVLMTFDFPDDPVTEAQMRLVAQTRRWPTKAVAA